MLLQAGYVIGQALIVSTPLVAGRSACVQTRKTRFPDAGTRGFEF